MMLYAQNHKIHGVLIDSMNQATIDYANIGIQGKNLGTVSNDSGYFELCISDAFLEDSLTFSRIGYATQTISIGELVKQDDVEIILAPKSTEIQEAKIVSRKLREKTKGNKVWPSVIQVFYPLCADPDRLGYEMGCVIRIPEKEVFLKDFNFLITSMVLDSVRLRLNIYDFSKGIIGDNILNENIYFVVYKKDIGNFRFDLSNLKISLANDVFISMENVAGFSSDNQKSDAKKKPFCPMMIRGTKVGSKTFRRKVSLGTWEESPGPFAPCFWVTILR